MNPSDLPQCSVFFFLLLLLFVITVHADDRFTNCSSHFNCGIVNNVGYPFWGDNRAEYCGQPDFHLACQHNTPKLIVKSVTYRILSFDLNDKRLTVARDDYWTTICPTQHINTSFDSTMFKLSDGFRQFVLLYDCSDSFDAMSDSINSSSTECSTIDGSTEEVYYAILSYSIDFTRFCEVVVVPITNAFVDLVLYHRKKIEEAIKEGFGLSWSVNNEECNKCVNSGGQCGHSDQKFTCFCSNGSQGTASCSSSSSETSRNRINIIAIVSAGGGVGIVIVLIAIIGCRSGCFKLGQKISKERTYDDHHHVETFVETYGTLAPRKYTYSEVRRITKSFKTKIGQGGYGTVYKATMPDGRLVAVKVLSETKGNGEEFINEVASISRTSHVNIVTLLGFCYEKSKRALIYEFMPNGSLEKFIYKGEYSLNPVCDFEWMRIYQISIGIARGLEYLHRGCNTRILHLDIKPQNILLDEDFCPKISDFGLAKICYKKESIVSISGMRGTAGYIAPEVFSRTYGGVSYKSDVYSYGMLILEMIGGRKNFESGGSHANTSDDMYFPNWIYKEFEQSNVVATNVSITEEEKEVVRKLSLVGLWCIQTDPAMRPSMSKVVEMLEGPNESVSLPPKPSLSSPHPRTLALHASDVSSCTGLDDSNSTPIPMETTA
ncbi:LEAF RUST 10 DISEASE-RESISTANCE LOCUS RECEPTOR-LIKE PROTEIN KINASE-like 2.7 [Neltuma alba]|uniref:LEAF RUST 10 DISEASE-RESISTANCE LOCUS RECEPTOR-LIKE PROTEIN KINASE-like 2.7 n=1 Tax=Neltuma alba TaxID=207710 RepID=UPI0010A47C92|nr:LEAF RUST 10 DISEASE-RESISTANCE LOCUS RECEPTOR-LIKE PROTEIN KINASE-like 2.7 [Prosopis alba]